MEPLSPFFPAGPNLHATFLILLRQLNQLPNILRIRLPAFVNKEYSLFTNTEFFFKVLFNFHRVYQICPSWQGDICHKKSIHDFNKNKKLQDKAFLVCVLLQFNSLLLFSLLCCDQAPPPQEFHGYLGVDR